jgi:DNA-binding LytR/AlgR family response regulator
MNCIIVDDEPLARKAIEILLKDTPQLSLTGAFNNAQTASAFMQGKTVDLVFLDIQMPGITGIEFAKTIPPQTLVIFTTAYSEYAIDSYEVDAVDFLVKPIETDRFTKAVNKAIAYHSLLLNEEKNSLETTEDDFFFVKSDRKYFKIHFDEILFIEGLKNYVVIQMDTQRVITKMTLKTISDYLPQKNFFRINKSYIVNTQKMTSFDNNDLFIRSYEIAIGSNYRDAFFEEFVSKLIKKCI